MRLKNILLNSCLAILLSFQFTFAAAKPVVLMFIIDGLQSDAAKVAIAHGASNLKFLYDNGVWVEEAYCVSPSPYLRLPDGSLPWGTSSPPNVAMHTGTHVFESRNMDDIFLAARRSGIKSVFAGGALNYKEFNTADYCYYSNTDPDSVMVQHGLDHFKNDGVQLIRLHMQRIRNHWKGSEEKLDPNSDYQQYILYLDRLLGKLIEEFKAAGVWDSTYVIVAGDHGMGMTLKSEHPASIISSWKPYMNFYGPGIKRGASIPYAESPDIALLVDRFLNLTPLRGHLDPNVDVVPRGTTGTLLTNIFIGNPRELPHPMLIKRYLESTDWKPSDEYGEYRQAMIQYLKELRK
ncbi:MAG TPA: alkaline phosphatase family protein [Bacteroidota bacterium]|nr:alkaline phosphatase family protein [Bacteroidota bacterium]